MHSWVFRHRARLRVLYGPAPEVRPGPLAIPGPESSSTPALPAGPHPDDGRVVREEDDVILHPRSRRAS